MSISSHFHPKSTPPNFPTQTVRAGIVGAGYIADFHALGITKTNGVELVSVCDANLDNAKSFASKWQIPSTYDSLAGMLQGGEVDSIHLLVPPDLHYPLAKIALAAKVHVLIEKPMCISAEESTELCALAQKHGLYLGVCHNMLYATPYQRLRNLVHSKSLGPIDYVAINHFAELGQTRSGPFDSWMLRSAGNLLLEIGPHPVSALLDLVGMPDDVVAVADCKIELPGDRYTFARWSVHAAVGRTAVHLNINLSPGFPQRTIVVRGLVGSATLDYDANTCVVDHRTALDVDLDRYKRSRAIVGQINSQARKTLGDYVFSKLKLRDRGNPYQITFIDTMADFYSAIRAKGALDARIDANKGRDVVALCTNIIQTAGLGSAPRRAPRKRGKPTKPPTVLVIGGTGFIGRTLICQLLAAEYCVRVAVRDSGATLDEFDSSHLEIVRANLKSESDLKILMDGIEFVYNLALSNVKSWEDHLRNNVEPARLIGKACLAAGVKRLIYTGTIDSYYAGAKAGTITEQTPLDPKIERRNNYAHAKAAAEHILTEMHRTDRLPLIIFRPGIVLGPGGNPFHFGVGMWRSEGVCEVWGDGHNKLPFVLVSDVASALVRAIQVPGIEGRSYNLIDEPILTARDYLDELERHTGMKVSAYYRPIWWFYLVDLFKWFVKLAVRHPDARRIPSYHDWESRTQKAYFDNRRAREELGWMPASDRDQLLERGVRDSLKSWLAVCH